MADATTVVEGKVKYREGKKWKSRWCVLKKPSPVADRLQLVLYKDVHEALRAGGRVKASFPLDGYYGVESGFTFDRESNVLAIICQKQIALMAFETRETVIQFEVKIRRSLGQDYQFPVRLVKVPSGSRLPLEGMKLLIHGVQFCLTAQVPPRILQSWNVADLRRFGAVDGKFCFEGGSRCGKGVGVHALQTDQAEEIAEILRVNSLGKSASSKSNNRSSQLLDYGTLWPPDGASPGLDPSPGRTRPLLGCCQAVPGLVDGDELGCRKRHSVSVTDFHRSNAITFQEKLRLMSMDSVERQRLMAIYDVPPKHPRKLETGKQSDTDQAESSNGVAAVASSIPAYTGGVVTVTGELQTSELNSRQQPSNGRPQMSVPQGVVVSQSSRVSVTSVAGREYCIPRSLDTSIFDSMVNAQVDSTKRNEALQRLQKQESDLQEEIILLDKMLQGCPSDTQDGQSGDRRDKTEPVTSEDPWEVRPHTLEPPMQSSTPAHVVKKASSLPPKIGARKDIGSSKVGSGEPGSVKSASDNSVAALRERLGTGEKSPLSPHLMAKLENIPWYSQLNAPLPYVNLAKYDEETDSGHVHLAGSGGGDSGCLCRSPNLLRNPAGGSLASLRSKSGVTSLPSRCFSETHIGPGAVAAQARQPLQPLPATQDEEDVSFNLGDLSSSTDVLDDDAFGPPTTYAPPVPYPRPLTTTAKTGAEVVDIPPSTMAPPVPSTACQTSVSPPIREPIYINEPPPLPPPRRKSDTPPPVLPPKGPALLRKTKQRSLGSSSGSTSNSLVPPAPPVRTRSLSVGSGKSADYDNQPSQSPTGSPSKPAASGEDNYLSMGNLQAQARESGYNIYFGRDPSRPASLYVTSSPKPRARNSTSSRRGNADVLSGYMDMANMFVEEPKAGLSESFSSQSSDTGRCSALVGGQVPEPIPPRELYISEPIQDSGEDGYIPLDSNYMEMSNFPPPIPQRKSSVLKNLEALHTFVSTTPAGEAGPAKPPVSTPTPTATPPSTTPTSSLQQKNNSKLVRQKDSPKSGHEKNGSKPRPAIPFTNLKSFEQKQSKASSYVNTYIPAPEVPLPEPPKKEEGFFARLIRRNSKDKNATQSQENLNVSKNRTSVFERSMSEQGEDEKALAKLKVGRRRSASFPNRLSFHETAGSPSPHSGSPSKRETPPPPLPPPPSHKTSPSPTPIKAAHPNSTPSLSQEASSDSSSQRRQEDRRSNHSSSSFRREQPSDTSSANDMSDDSDMAPLLKDGGGKSEMRVLTVLHVQEQVSSTPLAQRVADIPPYPFSDLALGKCADDSAWQTCSGSCDSSSLKCSNDSMQKQSDSTCSLSDSSKTDDEKLIELLQNSKQQSPASDIEAHASSGRDISDFTASVRSKVSLPLDSAFVKSKMSLPLDSCAGSPKDQAAAIARHLASVPPFIPPKTKKAQLSPVTEVVSPVAAPSSPPIPPLPVVPPEVPSSLSAPNQDEAIYVDMKELLSQPLRGPASPTTASQHPYNCPQEHRDPRGPREQKERARATLRITPAVQDEDGNIWVPRQNSAPGEIRPVPLPVYNPPPPLPGLSPRLPPSYSPHSSPRPPDTVTNLQQLRYTTPLVVSVDPLEDAGEGMADRISLSSQGSCLSMRSFDDTVIRSSPAATVLRPRSGRDYQVVERRLTGSESVSPSPAFPSPSDSNVFTYEECVLTPKSADSVSLMSMPSQDCDSSLHKHSASLSPDSVGERSPAVRISLSKERTQAPKSADSVTRHVSISGSSPPKLKRTFHRAQSEPCSSRAESPVISPYANSSPTSPNVPNAAMLSPEMLEPMLNYAEIDLTVPRTPPPKQITYSFRRHKKPPPKPTVIEYTQIDHTATVALEKAGREHAQSREGDSLRRGKTNLIRKGSTPLPLKDRKGSSNSFRERTERKLSTCSIESV